MQYQAEVPEEMAILVAQVQRLQPGLAAEVAEQEELEEKQGIITVVTVLQARLSSPGRAHQMPVLYRVSKMYVWVAAPPLAQLFREERGAVVTPVLPR